MTDKNKVLPIVVGETVRGYYTALAQRDADLKVLQRDYVPKEWVKLLVEALAWALHEGGWRLMYYAGSVPKIIIQQDVTSAGEIDPKVLAELDVGTKP